MIKSSVRLMLSMIMLVALLSDWQVHEHGIQGAGTEVSQTVDGWGAHSTQEQLPEVVMGQRQSASEFRHHTQLEPAYELQVEFLAEDISTKHFTYIRTIPDVQPWFELAAFVPNKMRLSGWKESRSLFSITSNILNTFG